MNNKTTAKHIRENIINMANHSKSPHVGSCLSCVDILTVLYFGVLKMRPWAKRDIFILSKAHSAMALYSALAVKGIMKSSFLKGYCKNNGTLPAHLDKFTAKGIETSGGSLGHGFNLGLGMAYGFKIRKEKRKVFVLIGDGESQEGSIWEGAFFAPKLELDNFTAITDYNNLQGYGRPKDICQYEPIVKKWESFGWFVIEVDGHDIEQLKKAIRTVAEGKPKMIIAHTTKGKGVSFMEDQLIWHYYVVTDAHKKAALKEIL